MSELFENNTASSFEFCVGQWSTIQKGTICTIVASKRLLKLCRHQLNENRRIGTHSNLVSELSSNSINSKHVKNVVSCSSFPFHCFRSDRNETCLELKCHVRESFSYARPGASLYGKLSSQTYSLTEGSLSLIYFLVKNKTWNFNSCFPIT